LAFSELNVLDGLSNQCSILLNYWLAINVSLNLLILHLHPLLLVFGD